MKIQTRITFTIEDRKKAERILDSLDLPINEKSNTYAVILLVDDDKYRLLTNELSNRSIHFLELCEMTFNQDELNEAEFLRMAPAGYWGYPQPENDFGYQQESYDKSSECSFCGSGAKQIKPFLVKSQPKFGMNDILAINWEYEFLITLKLKSLLEDAELTGVEFWSILNFKKRKTITDYYQLYITNELPCISPRTEFEIVNFERVKIPCPCGKIGRNLSTHQIIYKQRDLNNAKDFNKTHEWLGGGYGTTQWKIVSNRVYQLFRDHNIKRVKFEPILIES